MSHISDVLLHHSYSNYLVRVPRRSTHTRKRTSGQPGGASGHVTSGSIAAPCNITDPLFIAVPYSSEFRVQVKPLNYHVIHMWITCTLPRKLYRWRNSLTSLILMRRTKRLKRSKQEGSDRIRQEEAQLTPSFWSWTSPKRFAATSGNKAAVAIVVWFLAILKSRYLSDTTEIAIIKGFKNIGLYSMC